MNIVPANFGSYPRVGDKPNQMRLREAYQKWEMGEITDDDMEEIYRDYTREVIEEQESAGLKIVTDGQLRWYDPISHFAKAIDGYEIDGLLRYFDTNFYFRQPIIKKDIERKGQIVSDEFLSAKKFTSSILKPVVTGPYTLAKHSIDNFYEDFSEIAFNLANVLGKEVKKLSKAGAEVIQINEPSILSNYDELSIFSEAFRRLASFKGDSQLCLALYFGDPAPLYEDFQNLPTDILAFDFTYNESLGEMIGKLGSEKDLALGLINARNTKIEKTDDVLTKIREITINLDCEKIYLQPSCGVEFLPRNKAFEKLKKISEIAEKAEGILK